MKNILFIWTLLLSLNSFAQCVLGTTANGIPVNCYGDCNGMIYYTYQNTMSGNPGAPYIVTVTNSTTGQVAGVYTYNTEGQTAQFTNLCAGNYVISTQGNNCTSQTTAIITQPTAITANVNVVNPAPGQSNGIATFVAQGGVAPYTYSINGTTYQSSATFSGLPAGTYTGYVKDANGCIQTASFTLSNPAACSMVVTANGSNVLCFGACSAVIQYTYTLAGTAPCIIELQNSGGQVVQTQTNASTAGSGAFTNVCAGVYTIEVTDANGCTAFYTYTVGQPTQLSITNVATTAAAYGTSNGSATVTATGGTAPYTYSLNGTTYQSSNVFSGLTAGVHIAYVKDANGCLSIYTFVVQETTACTLIMTSTSTPVLCYGSSSGSVIYVYNNAVGPVSVTLQNTNGATMQSQTSQTSNGQGTFPTVPAGNYYIVITDASGCTFTNNISVNGPSSGIFATATTTPSSSGSNNGSITVNASGGTAPYTYSLTGTSGWQSSNVFTGLAAGVYIVYVKDANGCMTVLTVQLTQTTGCTQAITGTADHVDCAWGNNGSINYTFTSSGVGAPYTVNLINNGTVVQTDTFATTVGTGTFSNLASGVYTLQLVSVNGCVSTAQVYIDQPSQLTVSNVSVTNATTGMSNGSAVVTVTGGTAPYTYTLNNGAPGTSNTLTGLAAGAYIMWVEDANGCTTIYCFMVNESPSCPVMAVTVFGGQPITCSGACNGSLNWAYNSSGSAGPYVVTLYNGNNIVSTNTYTPSAYQGVFTGLCAGSYSVAVEDQNGCSASYSYTLTSPAPLYVTGTSTSATTGSANGSIIMAVTGGSGQYQYSLNNSSNWQSSNVFSGLASGIYIVYVQDSNGCMQVYTIQVGTTSGCTMVVTATSAPGSGCAGSCDQSINYAYTSTGSGPFTITLSDQNGNTQSQIQTPQSFSGSFTGLCAGVYIVTVQAANGCSGIYTVQIVSPSFITINVNTTEPTPGNADGAFTLNVTGGTPTYQYSIDNQTTWFTTSTFSNLAAGVYLAYTQDANTCTQLTAVKLGQSTADVIEVEDNLNIYPNPSKGLVYVEGSGISSVELTDMNGKNLAVRMIKLTNGWMADMTDMSPGVYFLNMVVNGSMKHVKIMKE